MKRNTEKVPGFDEIIFENRNKEYGAYDLRKNYNKATFWSLAGGVFFFTIITVGISLLMERDVTGVEDGGIVVIVRMDSTLTDLNRFRQEVPEMPKQKNLPNAYSPPEIVEKLDSGDLKLAPVTDLDSVINKPVDIKIEPVDDPEITSTFEPEPVVSVEEMPVFPGGDRALMKFINENIVYPSEAAENNIEGRVVLKFVVAKDGSVTRITVIKGVHPVLDQEASRVISLMPKWKAGKQNGEAVPVWYTVPVNFKLKRK